MGRRISVRWGLSRARAARSWIKACLTIPRCRKVVYAEPETDDRAKRIGLACPGGVCELVSVGKFGSPGRIVGREVLHSLQVDPPDIKLGTDQLSYSFVTHAEKKGMSVMRDFASNSELAEIISRRLKADPKRKFIGVLSFSIEDIKELRQAAEDKFRIEGERLYYALDSDMEELPNHADIFVTLPSKLNGQISKEAFRAQRVNLVARIKDAFVKSSDFRDGHFS